MKKHTILLTLCCSVLLTLILLPQRCHAYEYKSGFTSTKLSSTVRQRITGSSFPRRNGQIRYRDLRYLQMQYINFKGETVTGEMIVHKKIARQTLRIFYQLYQMQYPIQRMTLVDDYDADDEKSMSANNTSAFNYRTVSGTTRLSMHGKGLAIDINPRINPCVTYTASAAISRIEPANGKAYIHRQTTACTGMYAQYMIHKKDAIVKIFRREGFTWGGSWNSKKDYQHFEYTR